MGVMIHDQTKARTTSYVFRNDRSNLWKVDLIHYRRIIVINNRSGAYSRIEFLHPKQIFTMLPIVTECLTAAGC